MEQSIFYSRAYNFIREIDTIRDVEKASTIRGYIDNLSTEKVKQHFAGNPLAVAEIAAAESLLKTELVKWNGM